MPYLLSVVVPTKNRYDCLEALVDTLLSFDSPDLQVVVHDNSQDNSAFLPTLKRWNDSRLRYVHVPQWLAVSENCDRAVALAEGEYVCMLGDDDGLMPWAIDCARWMKRAGCEGLVANKPLYLWPGVQARILSNDGGSLVCDPVSGSREDIDVGLELKRVLQHGGTQLMRLPKVYHGLVAKAALDKMRAQTGSYFPGPSPDMANAVALAAHIRSAVWVDFPVVISGNCPRSTGGMGLQHEHTGRLAGQDHLPKDTEEKWSPLIPLFWSGSTIWAESALKALQSTAASSPVGQSAFNYVYLYASCMIFEPRFRSETRACMREYIRRRPVGNLRFRLEFAYHSLHLYAQRARSLVRNVAHRFGFVRPSENYKVQGLPTIREAVAAIAAVKGGMAAELWTRER